MKNHKLHWILLLVLTLTGFTSCSEDDAFDPGTGQKPSLNVTPATMSSTAAGSTKGMQITGNTTWSITGAPDWITLSEDAGQGTTNIQVTAPANEEFESRTATLTSAQMMKTLQTKCRSPRLEQELLDSFFCNTAVHLSQSTGIVIWISPNCPQR